MDGTKKIVLVSMTLLILICGLSFATAVNFNHNDSQHIHKTTVAQKKVDCSTLKSDSSKTTNVRKSTVKSVKSNNSDTEDLKSDEVETGDCDNASSISKGSYKVEDRKVEDVVNGWDPSEHEVSREDLGDGMERVTYDDGYFRIIDSDGYVVTYGY